MKLLTVSALLLITLFSFTLLASAQVRPANEQIPDEIKNAEIRSINGSSSVRLGLGDRKVTVLVLWASWCSPCRSALLDLNVFYKNSSNRGVDLIGLTTEDPAIDPNRMRIFLDTYKIDFKLGWIDEDKGKVLDNDRDLLPQILIIAPDGGIIKRFVGWNPRKTGRDWRKAVKKEFKKQRAR